MHGVLFSYKIGNKTGAAGTSCPALKIIGERKISKEEMIEKLNIAIRQYAKRQMVWFKKNKRIKWFRPEEQAKILKGVKKFIY